MRGVRGASTPAPARKQGTPAAPSSARPGAPPERVRGPPPSEAAPAPSRDQQNAGAGGSEHGPRPAGPASGPRLTAPPRPQSRRRTCEVRPGRCGPSSAHPSLRPSVRSRPRVPPRAPCVGLGPAHAASPVGLSRALTGPTGDGRPPRRREPRRLSADQGRARCRAPRFQSALSGSAAHAQGPAGRPRGMLGAEVLGSDGRERRGLHAPNPAFEPLFRAETTFDDHFSPSNVHRPPACAAARGTLGKMG